MRQEKENAVSRVARFAIVGLIAVCWLPLAPEVAGLRLDAYRIYLLIATIPVILTFLGGKDIKPTAVDMLFFGFTAWMFLSFMVIHGLERFPYATITSLEYLIGYLLGRTLVRNAATYRFFLDAMLVTFLLMFPVIYVELFTNRQIIQDLLGQVVPVSRKIGGEIRLGLFRSTGTMPHPILFGLFCATFFAAMVYQKALDSRRILLLLVVPALTFASLSSAPLLSLALQIFLIGWAVVMRGRWKLLVTLCVGVFLFLEIASNRGPVILLIETLTLNPGTAWWRVHIWNFGVENVLANPVFGLGLNDWARPSWLAPTVDNFWLNMAMRHGIPAVALLIAALVLHFRRILLAPLSGPAVRSLRQGYLISLTGLFFVLATVFAWGPIVPVVFFFVGAGAFFYMASPEAAEAAATPEPTPRSPIHTRFRPKPREKSQGIAATDLSPDSRFVRGTGLRRAPPVRP